MNPTDKMEMQVAEEQDGSAVVHLPSEMLPETEEQSEKVEASVNSRESDDSNDDSDENMSDISEDDPEREAIRAARREERRLKKQLHREKARESNHLINALKKQNQELAERLARVEKSTTGAEMARMEKAIEDAQVQEEYAKMKLREAIAGQDGEGAVQAQEMLYQARSKRESLQHYKANAEKQFSAPKQNINVPDPVVQKMAVDWMQKNSWYDPHARDVDSRIAKSIDEKLTEEGYDPSSPDYWEELDDRLKKYIPHRYNQDNDKPSFRNQRPRSVVTSSGREASSGGKATEYRVTPDRVAAMKEAGMWDNLELRNKMIRKFAEFDRQNKGRS